MRKGFLGSIAVCALCAELLRAQEPAKPVAVALPPVAAEVKGAPTSCPVLGNCGCCCDDCDQPHRLWFTADYLMWWIKKAPQPLPLVSTGSPNDPFPGAFGQPHTAILFGGTNLDYDRFNGMRFGLGVWLDPEGKIGVEGSYFALERRSVQFGLSSDNNGVPFIGRPTYNPAFNIQNDYADAKAGQFFGGIGISSSSRFQGWDANLAGNIVRNSSVRFDVLAGFRYLDLNEDLNFVDKLAPLVPGVLTFLGNGIAPPQSLADYDRFHCENHFYGGQIGGRVEWTGGRVGFDVVGKMAFGATHQIVTIDGNSTLYQPGVAPITVPGGVLAQTTNIGQHSRDDFAVVPEIGANLVFLVTENIRARVGYTFIYWTSVVRPGEQIDGVVNPFITPTDQNFGQGVGPHRPAFAFHDSEFWAQGINFGLEFRY